MKRRLYTILSAMSLLLLACTVVLWPVSYFAEHTFTFPTGAQSTFFIALRTGRIQLARQDVGNALAVFRGTGTGTDTTQLGRLVISGPMIMQQPGSPSSVTASSAVLSVDAAQIEHGFLGAGWIWIEVPFPLHLISIPFWLMILFLAILPAMRLGAWRRQRRIRRLGLCPTCGYDLRATPERCPECGREVAGADKLRISSAGNE